MNVNRISKDTKNVRQAWELRTTILFVMIFFFYATLAILSTTDTMLLREGEIALPIIQASVPVVEFYLIAPLVLVLLHLYLLAILVLYTGQTHDSKSYKKTPLKAFNLFTKAFIILFSFDQKGFILTTKNRSFMKLFLRILFLIMFGTIPLLVLVMLQVRFLAYQEEWITLYHQILITIDLVFQSVLMYSFYMLLMGRKKFLPAPLLTICIRRNRSVIRAKHILRASYIRRFTRTIRITVVISIFLLLIVSPLLNVWMAAVVPDVPTEKMIVPIGKSITSAEKTFGSIVKCLFPFWPKKKQMKEKKGKINHFHALI